jgi:regulator of sigma E protease
MLSFLVNLPFYILPYIVIVGVVITVHEFGHFLAAKAVGTKIDRFAIGFGKPLLKRTDRSGVEWSLRMFPIGGYVRFAGDDNAASIPDQDDLAAMRAELLERVGPAELRRYYHFKPIWQRALISAAGPVANFVLAVVIFSVLLMTLGQPVSTPRVGLVVPNSPAARAGFQVGDVILKTNGSPATTAEDVRQVIILRSGVPIHFEVDRGGRHLDLVAVPQRGPVPDMIGRMHQLGRIGVEFKPRPGEAGIKRLGPVQALKAGVARTADVITTTVYYIGRIVSGHEAADQISGPLGMAHLSGALERQTAEASKDLGTFLINEGLTLIQLVAVISTGIGFLNLMPIPVLDGGHLLFYGYEAVARRPLAAKVQAAGYRVGLALVLGLLLFATWNDLQGLRVFKFLGGLHS